MLNALNCPEVWQEFLEYKRGCGHLQQKDLQALEQFVQQQAYRDAVTRLLEGGSFSPPRKREISKIHSGKKRTVYTYAEDTHGCDGHHFHLKCLTCGRLFHLECRHSEALCEHIAGMHHFRVDSGRTLLYGQCEACQRAEQS